MDLAPDPSSPDFDPDEWEECDEAIVLSFWTRCALAALAVGVASLFFWLLDANKRWQREKHSRRADAAAPSDSGGTRQASVDSPAVAPVTAHPAVATDTALLDVVDTAASAAPSADPTLRADPHPPTEVELANEEVFVGQETCRPSQNSSGFCDAAQGILSAGVANAEPITAANAMITPTAETQEVEELHSAKRQPTGRGDPSDGDVARMTGANDTHEIASQETVEPTLSVTTTEFVSAAPTVSDLLSPDKSSVEEKAHSQTTEIDTVPQPIMSTDAYAGLSYEVESNVELNAATNISEIDVSVITSEMDTESRDVSPRSESQDLDCLLVQQPQNAHVDVTVFSTTEANPISIALPHPSPLAASAELIPAAFSEHAEALARAAVNDAVNALVSRQPETDFERAVFSQMTADSGATGDLLAETAAAMAKSLVQEAMSKAAANSAMLSARANDQSAVPLAAIDSAAQRICTDAMEKVFADFCSAERQKVPQPTETVHIESSAVNGAAMIDEYAETLAGDIITTGSEGAPDVETGDKEEEASAPRADLFEQLGMRDENTAAEDYCAETPPAAVEPVALTVHDDDLAKNGRVDAERRERDAAGRATNGPAEHLNYTAQSSNESARPTAEERLGEAAAAAVGGGGAAEDDPQTMMMELMDSDSSDGGGRPREPRFRRMLKEKQRRMLHKQSSSVLDLVGAETVTEALLKIGDLDELSVVMSHAGLERSNLIFGIDYTASNKYQGDESFNGKSLHTVSADALNPYQQVISIVGRTLAPFATSGHIAAFGFGDVSTSDWSVFPLKAEGSCGSFDEVLAVYNQITPRVILSGPTNFAPLIYQAIDICQQFGDYHILVIVADGQVTNERATRRAIVDACSYALSIIVVGVGDGPWDMMRVFDESLPKRPWDNFHFIEFHKTVNQANVKDAELAFAIQSLVEIPVQYEKIKQLGLV